MLLDIAKKEAATKSNVVGLGVGLYGGPNGGYGAAQKLYVDRSYRPGLIKTKKSARQPRNDCKVYQIDKVSNVMQ